MTDRSHFIEEKRVEINPSTPVRVDAHCCSTVKAEPGKTVLVIAAGLFQIPVIKAAKALGHHVIATDINPQAPGFAFADEHHIVSSRDMESMLTLARKLHKKRKIDAVLTMGTDVSHTVSRLTDEFGLPGINYANSLYTSVNKKNMRYRLLEFNVPQPQFYEVSSLKQAQSVAGYIGYPVVLKPEDAMGARGVIKVDTPDQMEGAFAEAWEASLNKQEILVEDFIPGDELSIDCLVYKGRIHILCIGDRLIRFPPYFVEIGHHVPSQLPAHMIEQAKEAMIKAIRAIGITNGAAKGDIKVNEHGAFVGEVAGRLSGGFMSSHTLPLSTGIDAAGAAVQIALGEKPDLTPKFHRASVERAFLPGPGRVKAITGLEEGRAIPGVVDIHLNCKPGDILHPLKSNIGKAGNVITVGDTLQQAMGAADLALVTVRFETV
ncbi:MAG: ATP-grasp domain-containing protein [Candidatus Wallbacteria bacterium]|nr:ATP-grasp domain-containing protein [Candidatus Wallbacteria bacterium]